MRCVWCVVCVQETVVQCCVCVQCLSLCVYAITKTAQATEEAILNSLCKATTVVGKDGKPATALPLDLLLQILRKRRVLLDKN